MNDRKRPPSPFEIRRQLDTALEGKRPLAQLRALFDLSAELHRRGNCLGRELHETGGFTWEQIGAALGTSKQSAYFRFGRDRDEGDDRFPGQRSFDEDEPAATASA